MGRFGQKEAIGIRQPSDWYTTFAVFLHNKFFNPGQNVSRNIDCLGVLSPTQQKICYFDKFFPANLFA